MRLRQAVLAVILALPPTLARSDDAAAIRRALADWAEAFNRRDADASCELFAPDLIARIRDAGVHGKAEVCRQISTALADDRRRMTYEVDVEEVIVSGDLAAVRLVWTLRVRQDGKEHVSREPGLDLFRRQPDGAWRIARFLAYSEDRDQ